MAHPVDLGRIGEYPAFPVAHRGSLLPAPLPQSVHDLHVFVGEVVALVVARLDSQPHAGGRAVEIAGDDVPAGAPTGQMVQRRQPTGQRVGRLVGERTGNAESEMLGHRRHGGHEQHRVADRNLHRMAQRRIGRAAINVIDAEYVGQKNAIEPAAFQNARQPRPVIEVAIAGRAITRMRPQPRRLMADCVHLEGVEADLLHRSSYSRHSRSFGRISRVPKGINTASPDCASDDARAEQEKHLHLGLDQSVDSNELVTWLWQLPSDIVLTIRSSDTQPRVGFPLFTSANPCFVEPPLHCRAA